MDIDNLRVSLLQNHHAYQSKAVGIEEVVGLIKHDNNVRELTNMYRRRAHIVSAKVANDEIKQQRMPVFSVAVLFDGTGKQLSHITAFTGLCFCDIDHVENVDEAFRLCKADPHTFLVYHTISGKGLRVISIYQRADGNPHLNAIPYAAAYLKMNRYYAELTGTEYDKQCGNVNRLSGLAHDPEVYLNTEAEPFLVSEEEMLEENFAPRRESGKPRKEYPRGTHTVEPEKAAHVVEQMMTRRDISYGPGTHHDYVLHAAYAFNRLGCELDDLLNWATQEWADYNADERKRCINWVYKKYSELFGTWRLNKQGRRGEVSMITVEEICNWLKQHHIELMYNHVTDQTYFCNRNKGSEWQQMDNRAVASLRCTIAKDTGKRVLKADVIDVIQSDFALLVHPVRDYINGLPRWDGTDRVAELAAHVMAEPVNERQSAEEAQELLRWALHKWMVASVATWMSDDQANQTIFTLIGPQGIYKTTFFRFLLPPCLRPYFWENAHNSFASKDDHIALAENCLVEIEEVGVSRERELSELKSLATSIKVKERKPYGRFPEVRHRLASFCATGNTEEFLTDETGNRRWLCFKVRHIDDPHDWKMNYDQLYAQLRDQLREGFRYYFDMEEKERVEEQNRAFSVMSDEEQLILQRFRKPTLTDTPVKWLTAANIAQLIGGGNGRGYSSKLIANIMRKLGFAYKRFRDGRFYQVFEIPFNELQSQITSEGYSQITDTKTDCDIPIQNKLSF